MTSARPAFRIIAIDCFERPLRYRMPFRFGAATVTEGVQAFVRARIRLDDGREATGASAELMVPKWFDKNPAVSNDDNVAQLRSALAIARAAYLQQKSRTAFGHFAAHANECAREGERQGLPALAAAFGPAEIDKAVIDALCRALGVSFYAAMRSNVVGFAPGGLARDVADIDADAFLQSLAPQQTLQVRHTVGIADPLRGQPHRVADGLPESLEQAIGAYGLRWFKLKLGGDVDTDRARLADIAGVLDALPEYGVTLDGNEQFTIEALAALLQSLREERSLRRLCDAVAFVEQPLPRNTTFDVDVRDASARFPLLIDEADATLDAFPRAWARGYRGVSSKSCKGLYKSLTNAMRCAAASARAQPARLFASAEDLTTPAGLAVQQDLALVSLLGIAHVERNGYHYVDPMTSAGTAEQRAFLASHPDLYEAAHGSVRIRIRGGAVAIGSLDCAGFASKAVPDWNALAPLGTPRSVGVS